MTDLRLRRSVLYMPGSNARALEKAKTLPADSLILDLEDAVGQEEKELAREQVCAAVKSGGYGDRELVIRVNAPQTPWGDADLRAAIAARPDAILMPKVSSPAVLESIADHLEALDAPEDIAVWAMIETPMAVVNAAEIASAARDVDARLSALVVGPNDLLKAGRIPPPGRAALTPWLMQVLAAARAYEIEAIDGVFSNFKDGAGFEAECRQGRELGFDGKMLIHPAQIEAANRHFGPDEAAVSDARQIIAAFAGPGSVELNVINMNGRMIERLHVAEAERLVAMADIIAARKEKET